MNNTKKDCFGFLSRLSMRNLRIARSYGTYYLEFDSPNLLTMKERETMTLAEASEMFGCPNPEVLEIYLDWIFVRIEHEDAYGCPMKLSDGKVVLIFEDTGPWTTVSLSTVVSMSSLS